MLDADAAFGFGIWLMPAADEVVRVTAPVARWPAEVGAWSPPAHITIRARFGSAKAAAAVAGPLQPELPLRLHLGPSQRGDRFWRASFRPVHDGGAVLDTYHRVCAAISAPPAGDYLPHLSLAYAEPSSLPRAALPGEEADVLRDVYFDRLEVWDLRGAPRDWSRAGPDESPLRR